MSGDARISRVRQGAAGSPSTQHARNASAAVSNAGRSISGHSSSTSSSSSGSSNIDAALDQLDDPTSSESGGAEDPSDSPLRRTVTRKDGLAGSRTGNSPHQAGGDHSQLQHTQYAAYHTVALGLRSFSNSGRGGGVLLSSAHRLAKDSLPSPPATSKGAESERGSSIGSSSTNNSQTMAALQAAGERSDAAGAGRARTRPSLAIHQNVAGARAESPVHARRLPPSESNGWSSSESEREDAVSPTAEAAGPTESPALTESKHTPTPDLSSLKTARPDLSLDSPSLRFISSSPSPAPRQAAGSASILYSSSGSSAARSRPRSPLAELTEFTLPRTDSDQDVPSQSSARMSTAQQDTAQAGRSQAETETEDHLSSDLARTESLASDTSHYSGIRPVRGTGEHVPSPSVSRSGSITASRIRKAGEATRQRMYTNSEAVPSSSPLNRRQSANTSSGSEGAAHRRLTLPLIRDGSKSSSDSTAIPSTLSGDEHSASQRRDGSDSSSTRSSGVKEGGSTMGRAGSEAFARNNRNSMISLSDRPDEQTPGCPGRYRPIGTRESSRDVLQGLRDLRSADSSLEEGEIVDEIEPRAFESALRRLRQSSVEQEADKQADLPVASTSRYRQDSSDSNLLASPARMSRQSSGSGLSEGGYAAEALRRSGMLGSNLSPKSPISPPGPATDTEGTSRAARNGAHSRRTVPDSPRSLRQAASSQHLTERASISTAGRSQTPARQLSHEPTHSTVHRSSSVAIELPEVSDSTTRTPDPSRHVRSAHMPQSARVERSSTLGRVTGAAGLEREDPASAILPRRSITSLSNYSDLDKSREYNRLSAYAGSDGSTNAGPPSLAGGSRRRARYSHSPDRGAAIRASNGAPPGAQGAPRRYETISAGTRREWNENRSSRSSEASWAREAGSRDGGSQYSPQRSIGHTAPVSARQNGVRYRSREQDEDGMQHVRSSGMEEPADVLDRVRRRTLSTQSDRARDGRGSGGRTDVFNNDAPPSANGSDRFRTIASSRPRTSANLRDLEVGSPDWWDQVSDIRHRTSASVSGDRPASRAESRAGGQHGGRSTDSPHTNYHDSSRQDAYPDRQRTIRDRVSPAMHTHRQSSATDFGHFRRSRSNSITSSEQDGGFRQPPSSEGRRSSTRSHTPQNLDNHAGNRTYDSPSTRAASRLQTIPSSMSMRKLRSANQTPIQDGQISRHQRLLMNALYTFEDQFRSAETTGASELAQQVATVVGNANIIANDIRRLLDDIVAYKVEKEVDGGSESRTTSARREGDLVGRIERIAAQLNRASEDQVRGFTEVLISMTRMDRQASDKGKSADPRPHVKRRESRDHVSSEGRQDRSFTAPSAGRSSRLSTDGQQHSPYTHGNSSRHMRSTPHLERIDSVQEELQHAGGSHGRGQSEQASQAPQPSPRSLRRAKSSSTSQVSQSTVRGFMANFPPSGTLEEHYTPILSSRHSSRRSSLASVGADEVGDVSVDAGPAILSNTSGELAAGRLAEHASHTPARIGSGSSRWRPFSKSRPSLNAHQEDLPDSPSINGANRSSEFSRTFSRLSLAKNSR